MPSYVGIGTSITHNVEVDGNLFLQDIEGGPDSTRVPLEIFSNLVSSSVESANSRMLRLRVQNYGETDTSNSYVTDMGIRGDPGKDYFFITAPQNTSNVGDQNTFVISKTSNVGIGTTDPTKPLHVVGDSWVTGTLTTSNIIGASPVTISSNLVMASGFTLTAGAIEPPTGSESNLKITGTITTSNLIGSPSLTVTANTNVVAEFTESSRYYNVKEPRSAMTANSSFGYTASVSSELSSNWTGWKAFNGIVGDDGWHDAGSKYSTINGSYDGSNSLGGYSGEWIKLQLPDSIKLTQIRIAPRNLHSDRAPKDAVCLGSTDGSNWYLLTSWSNASYTDGSFTNFYVNTDNYYDYIAIVTTQIDSLDGTLNISEIEYYGYPENDLGDGTDVIFKTVPNTPKADFLDVYYDAREYSGSGNITDESGNGVTGTIGSSVSYTSTEPKAWNFDGTVNGTVSASLTTPGGDWPHTLAVWFKADSITTTQSTNTIGWFGTLATRQSSVMKISPTFIGFDFVNDSQDATLNVQTGIWYHAVFVYPGGGVNNAKIYVNGFDAGATGGSTNAISLPTSTTLYLANQTNSFNPYFNGSIANYRLYDRALSADEITELYDYQKAYFQNNNYQINYKNGFVGIGTSEPRAVLDVVGDVNVTDNLIVGTSNLFVDNVTGRVGIGTDSPLRKLDVRSGDAVVATNWISGAFGPELSAGDRVVIGNLYGKACIGAHNSGLTGWADLTINSAGGNVGIGTTNPWAGLHQYRSVALSYVINLCGGAAFNSWNTGIINLNTTNRVILLIIFTPASGQFISAIVTMSQTYPPTPTWTTFRNTSNASLYYRYDNCGSPYLGFRNGSTTQVPYMCAIVLH